MLVHCEFSTLKSPLPIRTPMPYISTLHALVLQRTRKERNNFAVIITIPNSENISNGVIETEVGNISSVKGQMCWQCRLCVRARDYMSSLST